MQGPLLLGCLAVLPTLVTSADHLAHATASPQDPRPQNQRQQENPTDQPRAGRHDGKQQQPDPARGHLVLILQGNAKELQITHAVAKSSPWGGPVKGIKSDFALVIVGDDDRQLRAVPIDLSMFLTDPARIDAPVVVTGCRVRSPKIGVLLNIPRLPAARRYELRRGKTVIGRATADAIDNMLRGTK